MSTSPQQADLLDLAAPNERAGFRLEDLEIYNWGTFDERIWHLHAGGDTSLLTGDIGSGKSTVVDALTTLLVAPQKISYNKAAGAESRERSARSYVLGFYKAERSETGSGAKPVALRDMNTYSVLLARFHNEGYGQQVTVAQVFWMKDVDGQPARFFVVADRPLSIAEHFSDVTDIAALKKRLRGLTKEVSDTYPPYQTALRKRFGIQNEQALELFHQTVSMKSVGNLTEFVRQHMLQPFPIEDRIGNLIRHVDDLTRAHEAVLRAKDQMARLIPVVAECDEYDSMAANVLELRGCRAALTAYMAETKGELLRAAIADLQRQHALLQSEEAQAHEERAALHRERDAVKADLARSGGDRVGRLKSDIATRDQEAKDRKRRSEQYDLSAAVASMQPPMDAVEFATNQLAIAASLPDLEAKLGRLRDEELQSTSPFAELRRRHDALSREIASLRHRPSNIPAQQVALRTRLCAELDIDETDLPFAGELIRVRDDERDWEGAIERELHGLGVSLLVPDEHYGPVSQWVNQTHLGQRLVYLRPSRVGRVPPAAPNSLYRKLTLKLDSPFAEWLEFQIIDRHNLVCCESLEQFRREKSALTRAGQLKKGGVQHIKDDRYAVADRTRYVLGWSSKEKVEALLTEQRGVEVEIQTLGAEIAGLREQQAVMRNRLDALKALEAFREFNDIDWQASERERARLTAELAEIEATSDLLKTLRQQLQKLEAKLTTADERAKKLGAEVARFDERRKGLSKQAEASNAIVAATSAETRARFPRLEELRQETGIPPSLSVETCDAAEQAYRHWLQAQVDSEESRITRARERILKMMAAYCNAYPAETREVGSSVNAAGEYRRMLETIRTDDLPRFEAKFKELLNENTIREVVNFQSQLNREQHDIRERIGVINRSLREIEFNPSSYIELDPAKAEDAEVRSFVQDLRACTEGTLVGADDEAYSEAKFLQVKRIIERFRGREGSAEIDRAWTRKVTDVRNWFSFSATERWVEDNSEHEHYTGSGGKSGGQKEKLAYTVLAASLAYQFGLEWGETRSRSFRFVVIDEAFGRGSDESATYALELFKKLNLQLLVVTPLQKIHVIEPYVWNVGFVHNMDGERSKLRNLSIEEYRAEKALRGN